MPEWNIPYLKSIPGILGVAEVALNAIVFICAVSSGICFRSRRFMIWPAVAGAIGFWIALSLLLLHLIMGSREAVIQRLSQVSKTIQWFMIEGAVTALGCIVHLTIFLDCAVASSRTYLCQAFLFLIGGNAGKSDFRRLSANGVLVATAFFAFAATVVYGVDLFLKFREWRSSSQNTETPTKTDPQEIEKAIPQEIPA